MSHALPLVRWPASRGLLSAIARFDALPAQGVSPERAAMLLGHAVPDRLWRSPRALRHLNEAIRSRMGGECPCLEIDRAEWRLALLPAARLQRLAAHIAALLVAGEVRRALSRDEVCAWRDWLGQDAHDFAQTTVSLLPLVAPTQGAPAWRQFDAVAVGCQWMARASEPWPPSLRSRFLLKLPVGGGGPGCPQDPLAAGRLVQAVLTIVEGQWCSSIANKPR